ncbi:MAG: KEOPS complex subunit Pcc1 [Candidatus Bathyarchaeota archaeon]|nr:KEOPS complex subunit Pcc1 [Candidatus Bathyarchaeota archaeon]MDH5623913.1 KEOPS complex subunit Pcc1 [Candidatus Bathyarchaeota archaeon]
MKAQAIIRLNFSSEKQLKVVLEALKPETTSPSTRRSKVQMKGEGNSLTLNFKARDTSALRAAVNSYLRWILLTKTVLESVSEL